MKEIMERRSIRKYQSDAVPKEDIATIIQAGTKAPSAKNRQHSSMPIMLNFLKMTKDSLKSL